MRVRPYGYPILPLYQHVDSFDNHIERRLSSLRNKFMDGEAFQAKLDAGDPLVYEVYENPRPELAGELASGLSVVHPGRVGQEYYMTKGHYHTVRGTAEVYYCVQGKGVLLMENEAGDVSVEEFFPGRVVYVMPNWAHRSINTGDEDLVTFFVYPANAGHDYATIDAVGFSKRFLERNGQPTIVENPISPRQRS